jgi:hypothetical protein
MPRPNCYHATNIKVRTFHFPSGAIIERRYSIFYGRAVPTGNVIPLRDSNSLVATISYAMRVAQVGSLCGVRDSQCVLWHGFLPELIERGQTNQDAI